MECSVDFVIIEIECSGLIALKANLQELVKNLLDRNVLFFCDVPYERVLSHVVCV